MGYNIFRSLFRNKDKPKQQEQETVTSLFSISIVADDEGYLNINCEWDATVPNIYQIIADTLFSMDEGKVAASVLTIISSRIDELDLEGLERDEFIARIVVEYAKLSAESKAEQDGPIINPIDVFTLQ